MPLLGWVFDENWAKQNPESVEGLLSASYAAKQLLAKSDEEWVALKTRIKPASDQELVSIRDTYRAGIPTQFADAEIQGARQIFELLAKEGGKKLVGDSAQLNPGTFWNGYRIAN